MARSSALIVFLVTLLPAGLQAKVPDFNPNNFSLHGAETLGMGGFGFEFGYGVPNLDFTAGVGIFDVEGIGGFFAPALDVTAQIRSTYFLSTEVGGRLRFRLLKVNNEGARHALAITVGGGYVLKQSVSPTDDQTSKYQEFDNNTLVSKTVAFRAKKPFSWPYDYRDTGRMSVGLLYSVRGGGSTGFFEAAADYWMPPDLKVFGKLVAPETNSDKPYLPGYVLERDPFWSGRFTAGLEFNLSINLNFYLAATFIYGRDPNSGKGTLRQKMNGNTPKTRTAMQYYNPFTGQNEPLSVPVVEYPESANKVTGQVMAGLLLFFN
ncbi:MAG: hypothetical protein GXP49_04980 [Deltaproteobacteria bacterium]|nr:hypothetical protein [Deltaproteobacteria bacterium]